jgi:predicted nucleotidyltransferase
MDPFEDLRTRTGQEWPRIAEAKQRTSDLLAELREMMQDLDQQGTSLVVFGSIGRDEVTEGSDVDWALLLDGPADPEHLRIAEEAEARFKSRGLVEPGKSGVFGSIVVSHDLIHHIGGVEDTNHNLTRRILLLLESRPLTGDIIHRRVTHGILARYVIHDRPVPSDRPRILIPHFLLNDFVRYWRTIAVDYAAKRWEHPDGKWAVRNVKLRLSRKLLLVAGLLVSFRMELNNERAKETLRNQQPDLLVAEFSDFLEQHLRETPLTILAQGLVDFASDETTTRILNAYDAFLGILADPTKRAELEKIPFETTLDYPLWIEARNAGREFGEGLLQLFYDECDPMKVLMRRFGVF